MASIQETGDEIEHDRTKSASAGSSFSDSGTLVLVPLILRAVIPRAVVLVIVTASHYENEEQRRDVHEHMRQYRESEVIIL
ncbi:hypothetical protein JCGZ_24682 [Jatropha curcas]|uniref:Uncharacterized protein n=1 Tax=Jatropha curcas TaxID=180498 RepID=A0A067L0E1_JATCU|nr:hypothetical protein JCGZ_24682 [Jatropha curcas]